MGLKAEPMSENEILLFEGELPAIGRLIARDKAIWKSRERLEARPAGLQPEAA